MKFRVTFEIDEDVEADDREEAVEKAIGNITGGGYFENELTEHIEKYADVEEIEEEEE